MKFTPEEREAMRLADEEIEREWSETAAEYRENKAISDELDKLAREELLDNKTKAAKKRAAERQRRYYEENKDAIADYQRRYREEHSDQYRDYMREYMREYRKRRRRKEAKGCA